MNDRSSVTAHNILGRMPPARQKDVVFFANLLALFYGNNAEIDQLRKEVGTLETYGSRLVPVVNLLFSGDNNILVLEREPDPLLLDYFQNSLRLTVPKIKIIGHRNYSRVIQEECDFSGDLKAFIKSLRENAVPWVDGFVTDPCLARIAELTGKQTVCPVSASRRCNNKLLLYEEWQKRKLPVFDTFIAADSGEVQESCRKLKDKGYCRAVVKAQIGASGIGMLHIELDCPFPGIPDYIFYEGQCLVQGWLDENFDSIRYIGSPSVQMMIKDEGVYLFDLTEQLLSRQSIHEGNISPPGYLMPGNPVEQQILRQAEAAARWLHGQGYRGTASGDFHVAERDGRPEVRLCEINARVTGATYPSILARHFLPGRGWLMRNICFSPAVKDTLLLKTLEKHGLLFRPGKSEGILPFNFNYDDPGNVVKGQFLFLGGDSQSVWGLLEQLIGIESLHGRFDRD